MSLPKPGEIWDEKYRIERVLGEGGMGIVFEAYHLRLEQQVAIKCLLPHLAGDSMITARFEREARAAARLRSRHVVKILDVETHPSGVPYMVMELMRGRDLQMEAEQSGGRLPFPLLCDWLVQACGALDEAHRAGIIHRDLKPSNIFLAEEPGERVAKVLDFGIAKSNAIVPGITYASGGGHGAICGTPQYMSPEQIIDQEIDGRADLWAMGVIAYETLAGRPPFEAQTFTALAVKIANHPPQPLGELRPDLPPPLCAAIMRALSKAPGDRFADMRELAQALSVFSSRGGGDLMRWANGPSPSFASVPQLPAAPASGESLRAVSGDPATLINHTLPGASPLGGTRKWLFLGAGAVVLMLAGTLGVLALVRNRAVTASDAPTAAPLPPATPTAVPSASQAGLGVPPVPSASTTAPTNASVPATMGGGGRKPPPLAPTRPTAAASGSAHPAPPPPAPSHSSPAPLL